MPELLGCKQGNWGIVGRPETVYWNLTTHSGLDNASISRKTAPTLFYFSVAVIRVASKLIFRPQSTIWQTTNYEDRPNIMEKHKTAYLDDLKERLIDPLYAAEYLNAVLEDKEEGADAVFLVALRNVAEAFQMSNVAKQAGVNRENLYRMLSSNGNPKLSTLFAVLKTLGLRLSIQATDAA